ncbi:MAG: T9SS type A sorting domain-containing protein [Bacteroidales bacterium]|nr:T9SS type A sorting domain-containing protein [Bacteroidales bacterium]
MRKFLHYLFGTALFCVVMSSSLQTQAQVLPKDTTYLPAVYVCANDMPYLYAGTYYDHSGFFWVHFEGSKGQDSVCLLSITVYNVNHKQLWAGMCENKLSTNGYTYNGKTYYQSGIYMDTLVSSHGCDSVIHLTVNSYKTYSVNKTVELCQGETFLLDNVVYGLTPGTTVKKMNLKTVECNCDSSVTYTIIVKPSYNINDGVLSVCENELPYLWHGDYLYTTNNYEKVFRSSKGCDSVFKVQFTVKSAPSSSDRKVVCKDDLAAGYTYGSTVINTVGIYNVPFTAANGCDSTVTLTVYEGKTYRMEKTVRICQDQLPYYYANKRWNLGRDSVVLTSQYGCDSVICVDLQVYPTHMSNDVVTICEKDLPYMYHGHYTADYRAVYAGGTFQFVFQDSVTGCYSDTCKLTLNVIPSSETNLNITVCDDALPYVFDANNTFTLPGDYTISYQNGGNCDSIIRVHFVVNPTYKVMDNQVVCHQDFPYSYGDSTFTQGGYYTVVFTSATTCDSTVLLRIIEHFPPDSIQIVYGDEKIGKAGEYTFSVDMVATDFPNTYYEWTCNNPNWNIVRHNREGNVIYVDIPREKAFGEADITVKAINDCGESGVVTKHIKSFANTEVMVYPNPTYVNEYFTVRFCDMKGEHIVRITNEVGNVLHQETVNITEDYYELQLSTWDFASGNYFLRVETKEKTYLKKIVILTPQQ